MHIKTNSNEVKGESVVVQTKNATDPCLIQFGRLSVLLMDRNNVLSCNSSETARNNQRCFNQNAHTFWYDTGVEINADASFAPGREPSVLYFANFTKLL